MSYALACVAASAAMLCGADARPQPAVFTALASDGSPMSIEVRCEAGGYEVRLRHGSVDELPTMVDNRPRSRFHNAVRITIGWGLDLDRPDHHGATTYWKRRCGQGCVEAEWPVWIVESLKRNYTAHVRVGVVDARFDLAGSRKRIEEAGRQPACRQPL